VLSGRCAGGDKSAELIGAESSPASGPGPYIPGRSTLGEGGSIVPPSARSGPLSCDLSCMHLLYSSVSRSARHHTVSQYKRVIIPVGTPLRMVEPLFGLGVSGEYGRCVDGEPVWAGYRDLS